MLMFGCCSEAECLDGSGWYAFGLGVFLYRQKVCSATPSSAMKKSSYVWFRSYKDAAVIIKQAGALVFNMSAVVGRFQLVWTRDFKLMTSDYWNLTQYTLLKSTKSLTLKWPSTRSNNFYQTLAEQLDSSWGWASQQFLERLTVSRWWFTKASFWFVTNFYFWLRITGCNQIHTRSNHGHDQNASFA